MRLRKSDCLARQRCRCIVAAGAALLILSANPVTPPVRGAGVPEVLEAHAEYLYSIVFSCDGRLMVTASGDNTAIIWNASDRESVHVLPHDAAVYSAAIRADGDLVATASGDGHVSLWDVRKGTRVRQTRKHGDAVYSLAFSPDGRLLASAGGSTDGGDTACRVWCADDLALITELAGHQRQVYGLAFSPDGQSLATASGDKTARVWDLAERAFRVLEGHTSDVYRCDFSPDGRKLATASQDGTVRVWSLKSGSVSRVLQGGGRNPFYAPRFSPDGRWLAAVSDDRRLRIWRSDDLHLELEQQISPSALYAVAFSRGLERVMVGGEDGKVYVVDTPSPHP